MPRVSICTPVLNMSDWLRECIASVRAQSFTDWEMVIVDDGSTEDIAALVASFQDTRIVFIRLPENRGVAIAGNTAFRAARGEYVQPLSADEWIAPEKLAEQIAHLDANPALAAVFGLPDPLPGETDDQYGMRAYNRSRIDWLRTLLTLDRVPLSSASALWRRSVFDEIGYFDEELRITSDLEFYIRLFKRFEVEVLPKRWAGSRPRTDAISSLNQKNSARMRDEIAKVHAKHAIGDRPGEIGYHGKVVIVTPHRQGEGFASYISSLLQTITVLERLGISWDYWPLDGFSYVDQARNLACARFLEDAEATDLVFIDSDESWDTMGFIRLLTAPVEIVGGSYMAKNDWQRWTAQMKTEGGVPLGMMIPDGGALIEAEALPAGFLRIRRTALERFREAYPQLRYLDPAADVSAPDREYTAFFERAREVGLCFREDFMFCRRWRAIGGQLWIEPRVGITHFGVKGYFGNLDGWLRSLPKEEIK